MIMKDVAMPSSVTVECSVVYDIPGFDPETSCWRGSYCSCDSASSSTMCSSKQADSSPSYVADIHCENSDVMEEVLQMLVGNNNNNNEYCSSSPEQPPEEAVKVEEIFSCNSETEFFTLDDLWDSNAGRVPNWEDDFSTVLDDWMMPDADMIDVDEISDLEVFATNPA